MWGIRRVDQDQEATPLVGVLDAERDGRVRCRVDAAGGATRTTRARAGSTASSTHTGTRRRKSSPSTPSTTSRPSSSRSDRGTSAPSDARASVRAIEARDDAATTRSRPAGTTVRPRRREETERDSRGAVGEPGRSLAYERGEDNRYRARATVDARATRRTSDRGPRPDDVMTTAQSKRSKARDLDARVPPAGSRERERMLADQRRLDSAVDKAGDGRERTELLRSYAADHDLWLEPTGEGDDVTAFAVSFETASEARTGTASLVLTRAEIDEDSEQRAEDERSLAEKRAMRADLADPRHAPPTGPRATRSTIRRIDATNTRRATMTETVRDAAGNRRESHVNVLDARPLGVVEVSTEERTRNADGTGYEAVDATRAHHGEVRERHQSISTTAADGSAAYHERTTEFQDGAPAALHFVDDEYSPGFDAAAVGRFSAQVEREHDRLAGDDAANVRMDDAERITVPAVGAHRRELTGTIRYEDGVERSLEQRVVDQRVEQVRGERRLTTETSSQGFEAHPRESLFGDDGLPAVEGREVSTIRTVGFAATGADDDEHRRTTVTERSSRARLSADGSRSDVRHGPLSASSLEEGDDDDVQFGRRLLRVDERTGKLVRDGDDAPVELAEGDRIYRPSQDDHVRLRFDPAVDHVDQDPGDDPVGIAITGLSATGMVLSANPSTAPIGATASTIAGMLALTRTVPAFVDDPGLGTGTALALNAAGVVSGSSTVARAMPGIPTNNAALPLMQRPLLTSSTSEQALLTPADVVRVGGMGRDAINTATLVEESADGGELDTVQAMSAVRLAGGRGMPATR